MQFIIVNQKCISVLNAIYNRINIIAKNEYYNSFDLLYREVIIAKRLDFHK